PVCCPSSQAASSAASITGSTKWTGRIVLSMLAGAPAWWGAVSGQTWGAEAGAFKRGLLPGVDHRPLLAGARPRRLAGAQAADDPGTRFGWIDDGIDLQRHRHAERLAALVGLGHQLVEQRLARRRVSLGFQLLTVGQPHRSFQTHAAELAGGP